MHGGVTGIFWEMNQAILTLLKFIFELTSIIIIKINFLIFFAINVLKSAYKTRQFCNIIYLE